MLDWLLIPLCFILAGWLLQSLAAASERSFDETEARLLRVAVGLGERGISEFHGYQLGVADAEERGVPVLSSGHVSMGTLARALDRLQERGCLTGIMEDAERAEAEGRPPRRILRVTERGRREAQAWLAWQDARKGQA